MTKRTAIVTGASRGIGAAIAQRLANDGFNVVVNYSGSQADAEAVVGKIESAGGTARSAQADVSDAAAVAKMFDSAITAFGGVDVVVSNAGIMKLAKLADSDDALIDAHLSVNLKGTLNVNREAANRINDGGAIVNMSTTVVGLKMETYSVYTATKAAVESMTNILAKEMRGRDVTVNAVAPGPTATDLFLKGKPEEVVAKLSKMAPLERLGQPEDIANVVSMLSGPDGRWINGQVIRANGGLV